MREPKIEKVLHLLEIGAYDTKRVFDKQTSEDSLNDLWYFLHPDRVNDLYNEIDKLPEPNQESVVKSLISLYPWSKAIIVKLVENYNTSPQFFLSVYDEKNGLLDIMKNTIDEIDSCQDETQHIDVKRYKDDLDEIKKEIDAKNAEIEKQREKKPFVEKLEKLEKELDELRDEADEATYNEKIKSAEEKRKKLLEKKESRKKELNDIINEIKELKKEIKTDPTVENELEERLPEGKYEALMEQLEALLAED